MNSLWETCILAASIAESNGPSLESRRFDALAQCHETPDNPGAAIRAAEAMARAEYTRKVLNLARTLYASARSGPEAPIVPVRTLQESALPPEVSHG